MKLAADCQQCGREFTRPMSTKEMMIFCSYRCASARQAVAARAIIAGVVARIGKCENCGKTDRLHGHHKLSRKTAPLLVCDPANIEVLCESCHADEHPELVFLKRWRSGNNVA